MQLRISSLAKIDFAIFENFEPRFPECGIKSVDHETNPLSSSAQMNLRIWDIVPLFSDSSKCQAYRNLSKCLGMSFNIHFLKSREFRCADGQGAKV